MFEWSCFVDLARELAARAEDEAAARSAISRAYYASFHQAKAYVLAADETVDIPRHGGAHEKVPEFLLSHGRSTIERAAGTKLNRLKKLRKWADYERSSKPKLDSEVKQALKHAEYIVQHLAVQ